MFKVGDSIKITKTKMANDRMLVDDRCIQLMVGCTTGKIEYQLANERKPKNFVVAFDEWEELSNNGYWKLKESTSEYGLKMFMSKTGQIFNKEGEVVAECEKCVAWKHVEKGKTYRIKSGSRFEEWVLDRKEFETKEKPKELFAIVETTNRANGKLGVELIPYFNEHTMSYYNKEYVDSLWVFERGDSDEFVLNDSIEEL